MNDILKGMLFALVIVYIVSPLDLCPGIIDDLIVLGCYVISKKASSEDL